MAAKNSLIDDVLMFLNYGQPVMLVISWFRLLSGFPHTIGY
jgi:hypothetical protein